jgi:YfiH family protein
MVPVDWRAPPGVEAVSTARNGGVSSRPWDALNLATHVGDAEHSVKENRRRLRAAARLPAEPRWLRQVHGMAVADLDTLPEGVVPEADAAVATRPGVVCAVLTADCLPVLLAAADGTGVAAAHAGWRGLAAGVVEETVAALRARLPAGAALLAWLGPAIGPANFEVGEEVRTAFLAHDAAAAGAFTRRGDGHWHADLYQLARQRLAALGITAVSGGGLCTYADGARFYSHRRDVQHRQLPATGRMATLIWRQA